MRAPDQGLGSERRNPPRRVLGQRIERFGVLSEHQEALVVTAGSVTRPELLLGPRQPVGDRQEVPPGRRVGKKDIARFPPPLEAELQLGQGLGVVGSLEVGPPQQVPPEPRVVALEACPELVDGVRQATLELRHLASEQSGVRPSLALELVLQAARYLLSLHLPAGVEQDMVR